MCVTKRIVIMLLSICLAAFFAFPAGQGEEESGGEQQVESTGGETAAPPSSGADFIDPKVPQSWNEPPKTASELGITNFQQSPMLDRMVADGELPPVQERLPDDPIVIEPYEEIGKYGGTIDVWGVDLESFSLGWNVIARQGDTPLQSKYDGSGVVPWLAESWEYSDDYKEITLTFRKGLKWSDGEPFTVAEYEFWWDHFIHNAELDNRDPQKLFPPLMDITTEGDYKVTFHHGVSYPVKHSTDFQRAFIQNKVFSMAPSHYMKQFHPDFIGMDKVQAMADEAELDNWVDFYMQIMDDSVYHPEYEYKAPTMHPWVAVDRSETFIIFERNPYYPFVDTEGNQLPYIDKVKVHLATTSDMTEAKAITGEADLTFQDLKADNIPMYMKNQEKGDYKVILYTFSDAARSALYVNMTHEDSEKREIFQDVRFRQALSLAINREVINNKIYFGNGTPRQLSILPTSPYYKEEYGTAYAEFDPERAKALLDEMGMVDVDGDGLRETPDGNTFNPVWTYVDFAWMGPISQYELIIDDWRSVGLDWELESEGRSLYWQRMTAGKFDGHQHPASNLAPVTALGAIAKFLAPHTTQGCCNPWPLWTTWVASGGDTGMEPPANIKELTRNAEIFMTSPDQAARAEAMEFLSEQLAENLWGIGTVGLTPQPMIIKNSLKNVPVKGIWSPGTTRLNLFRPVQFWLDE